jgi:hypothetical protein
MTDKTSSERAVAQQTQLKFQFYFLSLVFTLLALTIQTARFSHSPCEDAMELAGWLGLLLSGLAGLSRREWDPIIRLLMSRQTELEGGRAASLSR